MSGMTSINQMPVWMLIIALYFLTSVCGHSGENCSFIVNEVHCHHLLGSVYQADVHASINTCSKPLDVTFQIKVQNESWSWQHTFVNTDETQPLKGLDEFHNLQLHVRLDHADRDLLHIMAFFMVDEEPMDNFLDASVVIDDTNQCKKSVNLNKNIPLVLFILLLVFIMAGLGMILWYRRCERRKPNSELLSDMEAPAHARPYSEDGLNIPYTDNPNGIPQHSIVIKNSIYHDSVLSEDGAAGGIPHDNLENLHRKRKKKRKKSKESPPKRSSMNENIDEAAEEDKDMKGVDDIVDLPARSSNHKDSYPEELISNNSHLGTNGASSYEQTRY